MENETDFNLENGTGFDYSALVAMNQELADSVLYMTVVVAIIGITGLIGNTCVLVVYSVNYPKCNFKYFVITLAIIDITSCLTTIPGEIFTHRNWYNYPDKAIWFCKMKTYFNGFTVFLLAFVLLLIAVDRYRKACQPLTWQIRPKRAIRLTVVAFVVAFVCSVPAVFFWGKHTTVVNFEGQNITIQMCEKDDNFKDTIYPSIFVNFVFFLPVICFMVATGVLYAIIIRKIAICSAFMSDDFPSNKAFPKISTISQPEMKHNLENKVSNASTATDRLKFEEDIYSSNSVENTPRLNRRNQKSVVLRERNPRKRYLQSPKARMRTKTLIMLIVTIVFFVTTMTYFGILSFVASKDKVFVLEVEDKTDVLFLFWRLYFINHVINPVLYGFMDPRFRQALKIGFFANKRELRWLSTRVESRHIPAV